MRDTETDGWSFLISFILIAFTIIMFFMHLSRIEDAIHCPSCCVEAL